MSQTTSSSRNNCKFAILASDRWMTEILIDDPSASCVKLWNQKSLSATFKQFEISCAKSLSIKNFIYSQIYNCYITVSWSQFWMRSLWEDGRCACEFLRTLAMTASAPIKCSSYHLEWKDGSGTMFKKTWIRCHSRADTHGIYYRKK